MYCPGFYAPSIAPACPACSCAAAADQGVNPKEVLWRVKRLGTLGWSVNVRNTPPKPRSSSRALSLFSR
jgi:hypothetical protein